MPGDRARVFLLAFALFGIAACGEATKSSADLAATLQDAINRRDVVAYERALAGIDGNRPLSDAALEQLAASLAVEMLTALAWPEDSHPSAVAIVRGAEVPLPWVALACRKRAEALGETWPWGKASRGPFPPRLAIGMESVKEFRRRLADKSATPAEAGEAVCLVVSLKADAALALAPEIVAAMARGGGSAAPNCRRALVDLGAPAVPHLAKALREGSSYLRQHAAWTLCFMPEVAGPAVPDLRAVLEDPAWQARRYASIALLKHDRTDSRARRTLCHMLVEIAGLDDRPWRWTIIEADIVDWLCLVEVLPYLRSMLESGDLENGGLEAVRRTVEKLEAREQTQGGR